MYKDLTRPRIDAFSLVELSIVLVILGLLTGGILAGRSLIRSSELRTVMVEHQRYKTAINMFRDKYFYLPGDIPNAQSIWGVKSSCSSATYGETTRPAGTCNGDGNGLMDNTIMGIRERYFAWQHLADAGLIEGTYTGTSGAVHAYGNGVVGQNIPGSKLDPTAGWCIDFYSYSNKFTYDYTNTLRIGKNTPSNAIGYCYSEATSNDYNGNLLPEEAWNIDSKLDDGKPGYGSVLAYPMARCTTGWNTPTVYSENYSLSGTYAPDKWCNLAFMK